MVSEDYAAEANAAVQATITSQRTLAVIILAKHSDSIEIEDCDLQAGTISALDSARERNATKCHSW